LNLKKLIPLYIGAAIGPMGGIGILPLIPVLSNTWSVEFSTVSLSITLYMVPFIIIQLFSGSIAQVFDVRKTLFFGFATYALGAVLCGLSPNLWAFLGSRVVQGVGAAFLTPIIMALIGEFVPEKHVGKAIGMLGVAYTVGVTMGPLLSGLIEAAYGWHWFFYFLGAISLTSGVLYAISSEPVQKKEGEMEGILAVLPILKRALFKPGVFYLGFAAFSFFIAFVGIMTFTADHLKTMLHLSSGKVGTVISGTGFSGILASPIAGLLGDRFGRRNVFLAGAVIAFSAILLMAVVRYSYSIYLILFLMLGTGTATGWTSLNTIAVESSSALRRPVTSVYNAIKFGGYALAPIILSVLYIPFELKGVQFGCMGAVVISAIFAVISSRRQRKEIKLK
jgi:MFS family permease